MMGTEAPPVDRRDHALRIEPVLREHAREADHGRIGRQSGRNVLGGEADGVQVRSRMFDRLAGRSP
jgi:hypothetical protein